LIINGGSLVRIIVAVQIVADVGLIGDVPDDIVSVGLEVIIITYQ